MTHKKLSNQYNLEVCNSALAKEWHPTRNGGFKPTDVTPKSKKQVWWQCSNAHEWQAIISNRSKGRGCPYCAGQKVCDDNNLLKVNPVLAKQWHPTKNGKLTPKDVMPGSNKKKWWQCKNGHEWVATISSRNNSNGCPYCSGRYATEETCLLNANPELVKEWHPSKNLNLTPAMITAGSSKKIWWQCKNGHEWDAIVSNRGKGIGCPFCSRKRSTKETCLLTVAPELAKEWHPTKNGNLTPRDVLVGSHKKVWWQCSKFKEHEWETSVKNRSNGTRCPYCAGQRVSDDNCLLKVSPGLVGEWHTTKNGKLTPRDITSSSGRKVWWQCEGGHEWITAVSNRTNGTGCPYCSGRYVTEAKSLLNVNPKLVKEWHPTRNLELTPRDVLPASNKKVWWQCKNGHEWQAVVNHRNKGIGCPYCSGRFVTKETCLKNVNPELVKEWHPTANGALLPQHVTAGSSKKVWWKCKKGHEWRTSVANRKRTNCPHCNAKISILELQIFSEIKFIFDDAKLKSKIKGKEIDIYIPSLNLGVEIDGVYWHKNKVLLDTNKTRFLENMGIRVLRLREQGLGLITENDIPHSTNSKPFHLLEKIYKFLLDNYILDESKKSRINQYMQEGKIVNASEFVRLWDMLPGPILADSLYEKNPVLAKEWHPTKNGNITPKDIWSGSGKKVWWQCIKNNKHEWEAVVSSRNSGTGCPFCAGQRLTEETCLFNVNPVLTKEWHPTKNGTLTPKEIMAGSGKKVWWQCIKNSKHEWEAVVRSRNKGIGCPYCAGQRLTEETCLLNVNPQLSKEWHPMRNGTLTPRDVMSGANRTAWWLCSKNKDHEWEAVISSRNSGVGCPYCAGQKVSDDNCLLNRNPNLAIEWHPYKNGNLTSRDVIPGSNKKAWWLCSKNKDHEWAAVISSRNAGSGCPLCDGRKVTAENCLLIQNAELAKEWHPTKNGKLTPRDVMPGSNKKVWWQCSKNKNHEWAAIVNSRNKGRGCLYCVGQKASDDNCLLKKDPNLAKEWHPTKNGTLTPRDVMPGSAKKAWWLCQKGHSWLAQIKNRYHGRGCPECRKLRNKNYGTNLAHNF